MRCCLKKGYQYQGVYEKNKFLLVLFICIGVVSCSDADAPMPGKGNIELKIIKLSDRDSGYRSDISNWKEFLRCWSEQSALKTDEPGNVASILNLNTESSDSGYQYDNSSVEKRLRLKVPNSLNHFYEAYISLGGEFVSVQDTEMIGLYKPSELTFLENFNPEIANVDKEWTVESPDEKYYQYGIEQETSSGRNSYLRDALVIGKYGYSDNELILLFPNSKTKDGEMEASILSYASEFRAPSFAEMMRQVSLLNTEDLLPPYPQEKVNLTCARYLPLENVWWR